jgi:predicted negative regulator of RcsB-dependent stress response
MVEIYDAHEQGEVVKKWLQENGSAIVMGLVIAFGGLFGFRQWQAWELNNKQQAYAEFAGLNQLLEAGQMDTAMNNFQNLEEKHEKSPYASLAALEMGRARMESKQEDLAIKHYRFVMENGKPKALRVIARNRLARMLLDQDKASEALEVIEGEKDAVGFEARYSETRGDILLALDRKQEALAAYRQALDTLESGAGDRNALELKVQSLSAAPPELSAAAADQAPSL